MSVKDEMYIDELLERIDELKARVVELENTLNEAADTLDGCRYSEIPMMKKCRAVANNHTRAAIGDKSNE